MLILTLCFGKETPSNDNVIIEVHIEDDGDTH